MKYEALRYVGIPLQPYPIEAHRFDSLAMLYTSVGDGKAGVQSCLEQRLPVFPGSVSTDMPDFYPWWVIK